jgi:predicted dehydrogenase
MGDRRPTAVNGFKTNTGGLEYADNTVGVLQYQDGALVIIDIDQKAVGSVRRLEVYGTQGTAIIQEPFEPGKLIKLILDADRGDYKEGEQLLHVEGTDRHQTYELDLQDFVSLIRGDREKPVRPLSHDLLTQETLLRLTGELTPDGTWQPLGGKNRGRL